jgi:processive 1,2-diacylglycerol beta-glucosyltransferase
VILVLTAGFGDGHNTAARSVALALRHELQSTPETVLVTDLFSECLPRLTRALQFAYQAAIVHFPWAWRWAYQKLATSDVGRQPNYFNTLLQQGLEHLLETHHPRCIVSTYPFYSTLLAAIRTRRFLPPLFTVVTDSVSVHPSWTNDPSDYYCVADAETSLVLRQRNIPAGKVFTTGFPVSPDFVIHHPEHPFSPTSPRILYLPSTPVPHVAATLEALRPRLLQGARLTLPAGKHRQRLYHTLTRFGDSLPPDRFELIDWTDRMPELLRSHDLVICKAGGAILHEVLAARIPAVIDYVVPGQEEGNAEMLLKHHCALRSVTPQETAAAVAQLLAHNAALAQSMRQRMIPPLSLPDAAHRTARTILDHA